MERVSIEATERFAKRIFDQARHLEGDLVEHLVELGLRSGMVTLELGSCIGLHARKVAEVVHPALLCSLDREHVYLQIQSAESNGSNIRIIEGDALHIPCMESAFDFTYSRFLFQHLSDPRGTLLDIYRVLKPNGIIVIIDSDDSYDTFFPDLPFVKKAFATLASLQEKRMGDRYIGHKLFSYLVNAGYRSVQAKVIPIIQQGHQRKEVVTKDIVPMFEEEYESLIYTGLIQRCELDSAISAMLKTVERDDSFYLGLIFIVSGLK